MLGLNFLVDNQVDQAIDELTQATSIDTDALEDADDSGQPLSAEGTGGRAINVHQSLLQRTDLTTLEHAYVLLCLGLDFRHGASSIGRWRRSRRCSGWIRATAMPS